MLINHPGKYTDFKRVFIKYLLKIMHIYQQEINNKIFYLPAHE